MPLAAIGIGIERPPLRLRYLEYNSTKGVDVRTLARHVVELYDVQLYSNVATLEFISSLQSSTSFHKLVCQSFSEIFDKFLSPHRAFPYRQQSLIELFHIWTMIW